MKQFSKNNKTNKTQKLENKKERKKFIKLQHASKLFSGAHLP